MKVTNTSGVNQTFVCKNGSLEEIEPRETRDIDVDAESVENKARARMGTASFGNAAKADDKPAAKTKGEAA